MNKLSHTFYKDGGYSIGETGSDKYITGIGYIYWAKTKHFAVGRFKSGKQYGWVLDNNSSDGGTDVTYFTKYKNGTKLPGVCLESEKEVLDIYEVNKNGGFEGYDFLVWDDDTWRYQYYDESSGTKAIQFYTDTNELKMTYRVDDNNVWETVIGKGKIKDFGVPFQRYKFKTFTNCEFEDKGDEVRADGNGPCIKYVGNETKVITRENDETKGLYYADGPNHVCFAPIIKNKLDGVLFYIFKDTSDWKYIVFNKGDVEPICVFWYRKTCDLQVRKYCYDDPQTYDLIKIDKDFNVKFYKEFNYDTKKYKSVVEYDYDEIYLKDNKAKVEEEEEKPKTKTTKVKKATKDSDDDWKDKFRDLFK